MIKQNETEEEGLTAKQLEALPFFIANANILSACEKSGVSRSQYYRWIKEPVFKAALKAGREQIAEEALSRIEVEGLTKAVKTWIDILESSKDDHLKSQCALYVVNVWKAYSKAEDTDRRLSAIEKMIAKSLGKTK